MPDLDSVHDHNGSAAISSEGHIPGAADPDFTITEDDRIGALIEAHTELTASVLRTLGHLTTAVEGMSRLMDTMTHAMEFESRASDHVARELDELRQTVVSTVNELADGAGLAPVDAPDDHDLNVVDIMNQGGIAIAANTLYAMIRSNVVGPWSTEASAGKVTIRSAGALCTIYTSGKATTGGSDHNLRDDLRAILGAEGFDVRC